jgi:hypothetical protein
MQHPIDQAIIDNTLTRELLDEHATLPLPPQGDSYWGDNMRDHGMDPVESARVAALQMGQVLLSLDALSR